MKTREGNGTLEASDAVKEAIDSLSVYAEVLRLSFIQFITYRALHAAVQLEIPDLLADGPKDIDALVRGTDTNRDALLRLLRVLVRANILEESDDGLFALTPTSAVLRKDVPGSLRGWVMFTGSDLYSRAWERLSDSIRGGRPGFELAHGSPFFDYAARHPDAQKAFDAAMSVSGPEGQAVVAAYDFSAFARIIDVGGGLGLLMATILRTYPSIHGAIFDQAQVVTEARSKLEQQGLDHRCDFVGGNFFESIPSGYDAYVLKYIVHDWDDEKASIILRNCRRAMSRDAKLLLIETINAPRTASHLAIIRDLSMLVMLGGKERSLEAFGALLADTGFTLKRVVPTACPLNIVEALPV